MLALKSGVGGLSSGTRVDIIERAREHITVMPVGVDPDADEYYETTLDNLVELRNRTDEVPKNSRYNRRDFKHNIVNGVHSPKSPTGVNTTGN